MRAITGVYFGLERKSPVYIKLEKQHDQNNKEIHQTGVPVRRIKSRWAVMKEKGKASRAVWNH